MEDLPFIDPWSAKGEEEPAAKPPTPKNPTSNEQRDRAVVNRRGAIVVPQSE